MTKRFKIKRCEETDKLLLEDNKTDCFYQIVDSFENVELLCKRLNNLTSENEGLKSNLVKIGYDFSMLEVENQRLQKENKQLKHWNKCLAEKRHSELNGDKND